MVLEERGSGWKTGCRSSFAALEQLSRKKQGIKLTEDVTCVQLFVSQMFQQGGIYSRSAHQNQVRILFFPHMQVLANDWSTAPLSYFYFCPSDAEYRL